MFDSDRSNGVAALAAIFLGSSLPLVIALSLLVLLGLKLILAASQHPWAPLAHRILNALIVPLLLFFALVVAAKLFQGLQ